MWLDNASEIDMLFYEPYVKLITKITKNKKYNPLTIGIFGLWGAGKSTLLKLIENELEDEKDKIVCVQINAWMFEGYEDAKTALMESLLNDLNSDKNKNIFQKVEKEIKGLLKRVDFFKLGKDVLKNGLPLAASLMSGNPFPMLLSIPGDKEGAVNAISSAVDGIKSVKETYIKDKTESTIENIRQFRTEFEEMLKIAKVDNVVVLVDDLDRCTPERIIETLEAIKLFLSVDRTTFIMAADETVIEYAIKKKYPRLEGSEVVLSDEYIEKIIQLPIYIPDLSTKDIENYLLLLVAQMYMKTDSFSELLKLMREKNLAIRETGMTLNELNGLIGSINLPFEEDEEEFKKDIKIIDGIKDIISTNLKGNPRQTKRFLNTFITKKELAQMYYGQDFDDKILAKLLVLQKISSDLFAELNDWNREFKTCNEKFKKMYDEVITSSSDSEEYSQWRTPSMIKWLKCEPKELYTLRLDKYFYLTREKMRSSVITVNNLTHEARDILEKIGNASEGTIDGIIDILNTLQPESIDGAIMLLLSQFEDGKIQMFVIKSIFMKCKSYRRKIIDTFGRTMQKYQLEDVAYFRTMLHEEPDLIKDLLDKIKDNTMPNNIYNKIFGKRGKKE